MIRPNIKLGDNLGAVLKYHCAINGVSVMHYIGRLIYEDLKKKQPTLMKDRSINETCVSK